jgi:putative component of membrane protein insertase Oxa1/YidC/SpoIIIJ protein YidD
MKIFFLLILTSPFFLIAQKETEKWEKAQHSYEIKPTHINHSHTSSNSIAGITVSLYKFFISDLDGDNCAFSPSCSSFFVESVNESGFFTGVLMTFDRLTRDFNPVGRNTNYPLRLNGKYYDPVQNYSMNPKINIHSSVEQKSN